MYKLYTLDNKFIEEANHVSNNFTGIVELTNGDKLWFKEGKWHRLDGPAKEYTNGDKYWYVNDKKVTKFEHDLLYSIMKLKNLI